MKGIVGKLILLVLMTVSLTSFADKIILTGKPVILMPEADYYTFPSTYVPSHNYHFVDISGDNRVCFLSQQPQLKPLDLLRINIVQNNKTFLWYCYRYDPRYFEVDY